MNLEDQLCSLQLAKRLKELGVKQDSLFYWGETLIGRQSETEFKLYFNEKPTCNIINEYSAFTVAELGEMLPHTIRNKFFLYHKDEEGHSISYKDKNNQIHYFGKFDKSEANCRAKILINLIEDGFIKNE